MSAWLHGFHFLYPAWLLAAVVAPLLVWWWLRMRGGQRQLKHVVDAQLLSHVLASRRPARQSSVWLLGGAWLVACLALAGPAWQRSSTPAAPVDAARVIVLSLADSMQASDVKPSRLARARLKVRRLVRRGDDARNALVAYAGQAFVVAPLTGDSDTVVNLLHGLDPSVMPVPGGRADRGIEQAVQLLHQAGFQHGSIILVADHVGDKAIATAGKARRRGMRVSVLGVGTDQGSPVALAGGGLVKDANGNILIPKLVRKNLRKLARLGGGVYQTLGTGDADVQALLAATGHAGLARSAHDAGHKLDRWRDEGPWLLLLLVPLAALGFRRGWLSVLALVILLPAGSAQAAPGWWSDLWRNGDQQAARALARGHNKQAQQSARSPGLRGAAAYQGGDYEAAAKTFSRGDSARAAYNLGNALARQQHYDKALQAWRRALQMDPDLADAQANIKAVKQWLAQHQKDAPRQPRSSKNGSGKQDQGDQGLSNQGQDGQGQGDQGKTNQDQAKQGQQKQGQGKHGKDARSTAPSRPADNNRPAPASSTSAHKAKAANKQQTAPAAAGQHANAGKKSADQPGRQGATAAGKKPMSRRAPAGANSAQGPAAAASVGPAAARSSEPAPQAESPEQAEQRARNTRAARRALGEALNKQLGNKRAPPAYHLGQTPQDQDSKLPRPLRQALRKVPDDPGGLLRRKFMLEYQRRQQENQQ